ncbi:MAG: hypothetical protein JXR58_13615 [Bacteroidales bacterium]|nr:hypothetical protein [Bacteroidales bacterium]
MRKFLILIFALSIQLSFGQTPAEGYQIDDINGQTIYGCEGAFFDSGGFAENC